MIVQGSTDVQNIVWFQLPATKTCTITCISPHLGTDPVVHSAQLGTGAFWVFEVKDAVHLYPVAGPAGEDLLQRALVLSSTAIRCSSGVGSSLHSIRKPELNRTSV